MNVLTPESDEYERFRHSYAYRGSPSLIIFCESADDVTSGLGFARSTGLPISVRSGGHGVSSRSTNDGGVIVDLSRMNAVEVVDERTGVTRIGPGARWSTVASTLDRFGLAIGSGDSGDVGVGGLAVSGGIGLLGRKFGLTIDALRSVEIVTADGVQRHASDDENPDLFWAVRGAGGQVGIVTSFEFVANRVRDVVLDRVQYLADDIPLLLERWGTAVEAAPREITSFLYLTPGPPGAAVSAESVTLFAGPDGSEARSALAPFAAVVPVLESSSTATNYASVVPRLLGDHTGDAPPDVRCGLATHLTPGIAVAVSRLLVPGTALTVQVKAVGGAVNDVDADATSYAHRHQNFCLIAIGLPGNRDRLWSAWNQLYPALDGLYAAFDTDRGALRSADAYPAAARARLAGITATFDPDRVFEPTSEWD